MDACCPAQAPVTYAACVQKYVITHNKVVKPNAHTVSFLSAEWQIPRSHIEGRSMEKHVLEDL